MRVELFPETSNVIAAGSGVTHMSRAPEPTIALEEELETDFGLSPGLEVRLQQGLAESCTFQVHVRIRKHQRVGGVV